MDNQDDLYVYGNLLSNQIFSQLFLRMKQKFTINFFFLGGEGGGGMS